MSRSSSPARRGDVLDGVLAGRRRWRTRRPRRPDDPRGRGRFGFWGPVPYYSRRTRSGSDVSVGGCGCCLPIPLLGVLGTVGGAWALWRRLR